MNVYYSTKVGCKVGSVALLPVLLGRYCICMPTNFQRAVAMQRSARACVYVHTFYHELSRLKTKEEENTFTSEHVGLLGENQLLYGGVGDAPISWHYICVLSPPPSRSCCSTGKWLFCITCDIYICIHTYIKVECGGRGALGLCPCSDAFCFSCLIIYIAGKHGRVTTVSTVENCGAEALHLLSRPYDVIN